MPLNRQRERERAWWSKVFPKVVTGSELFNFGVFPFKRPDVAVQITVAPSGEVAIYYGQARVVVASGQQQQHLTIWRR